jgi:hypothetical protein
LIRITPAERLIKLKMISVTALVKVFFEDANFNPDAVINKNFSKWAANPDSKYYAIIASAGETADEEAQKRKIKDEWKQKACSGKTLHKLIENHLLLACGGDAADTTPLTASPMLEFTRVKEWIVEATQRLGVKFHKSEWKISSPMLNIVGVVDASFTFSSDSNQLLIIDWKRTTNSNKLDTGPHPFGKKGKFKPFDVLPDTKFGHYSMQLNVYARIIESAYAPLKVKQMLIVQITDDGNVFEHNVEKLYN